MFVVDFLRYMLDRILVLEVDEIGDFFSVVLLWLWELFSFAFLLLDYYFGLFWYVRVCFKKEFPPVEEIRPTAPMHPLPPMLLLLLI
jgi:hypothetical protein